MWYKFVVLWILLFVALTGCQQYGDKNVEINPHTISIKNENNLKTENITVKKVEDIIRPMKEVRKMKVAALNKDIIAVLELKHLYTFRSEKIIGKAQDKIKKEFPQKTVRVTTDHKIYIELEKLEKNIKNNEVNRNELNKQMKKVKELLKQT
ncbi:YhcN/YlaJ family sporulation lipoprotein [Bacillus tianshenii]|nr:YhcN/YlaJ family sporulation lipoprotein [Bacillus tianshenii]